MPTRLPPPLALLNVLHTLLTLNPSSFQIMEAKAIKRGGPKDDEVRSGGV